MDDLMDFDIQPCDYQVIAEGFDEEGQEIGDAVIFHHEEDPDLAVQKAKELLNSLRCLASSGCDIWNGKKYSRVEVRVETVIFLDGEEQCEGAIYRNNIMK